MIREYRTIREVVSPLMVVKEVEGVAYDELAEIELPTGQKIGGVFYAAPGNKAHYQDEAHHQNDAHQYAKRHSISSRRPRILSS